MKLSIERSVCVITPSIGSEKLIDCIRSIAAQTYTNITHLIVADGPEINLTPLFMRVGEQSGYRAELVTLSQNTGANGFYGHRIYAAFPHLVNEDYIAFLDEDNWYEPNHIESLVESIEKYTQLDFAFSFRKVYDKDKNYICDDNCESLGEWPIWSTYNNPQYLIDTSSFLFNRNFLVKTCHLWHSGWGGDRRYLDSVRGTSKFIPSYQHSLCYRLDGNSNSVKPEFFIEGNKRHEQYYGGNLPWKKQKKI